MVSFWVGIRGDRIICQIVLRVSLRSKLNLCFISFPGKIIQASPCSIRANQDVNYIKVLQPGVKISVDFSSCKRNKIEEQQQQKHTSGNAEGAINYNMGEGKIRVSEKTSKRTWTLQGIFLQHSWAISTTGPLLCPQF